MRSSLFLIYFIPTLFIPTILHAGNTTNSGICDSGINGIECRKIVTVTNHLDSTNREWKKARVSYQFRSTNGQSCTVRGEINEAENMRIIYNTSYINTPDEWAKPGLVIEQIRKGIWPHSINWQISCRTLNFDS